MGSWPACASFPPSRSSSPWACSQSPVMTRVIRRHGRAGYHRTEGEMPGGALGGMRVLELGELVSAPYCARLFADYGAEVVKVEPPAGDRARSWGPFPGGRPDPEGSRL